MAKSERVVKASGADFLLGKFGQNVIEPKRTKGATPIANVVEYLESEETAKQLAPPDPLRAAKQLNEAVGTAYQKAVELVGCGLTSEALALLIADKCPWAKNGKRVSVDTVELVLVGMLKLKEHLR